MTDGTPQRPSFLVNTLWTWASVGANFVMAIFVTRLLVHRLGDEAYGVWSIVFSLVEYYAMFDFGIRAAVIKLIAEYTALGDARGLAKTLNASFLYFLSIGLVLFVVTLTLAPRWTEFFTMSRDYRPTFHDMILIAGTGWAISTVFAWFSASLEAVQRFDVTYRIMIATNVARVIMFITLLQRGYGLKELVIAAVAARLLQIVLLLRPFLRRFPQFRWQFWDVDRATFGRMFGFGVHVVPSTMGWLLLDQGPGVIIGHVRDATAAGYYALPRRLIQQGLDLVVRVGLVTTPRSAELAAQGDHRGLVRLGVYSNRYALAVFMPAAVFLGIYGDRLFEVWLKPGYVTVSAPLLPVFVIGALLAEASQFSSSSILYGMGKHQLFSWLVLAESAVSISLVYYFASRGSLFGAAAASTAVLVVNRGIVTPALICAELDYPFFRYVAKIMTRPLLVGSAVALAMAALRLTVLPGKRLREVAAAAVLCTGLYVILAARFCLLDEHKRHMIDLVRPRLPFLVRPLQLWFGVSA